MVPDRDVQVPAKDAKHLFDKKKEVGTGMKGGLCFLVTDQVLVGAGQV